MLKNNDYCDYETCVALKELGFSEPTLAYYHGFLSSKPLLYLVIDEDCIPEDGVNVFDLLSNSNKYKDSKNIDAPTLYEAQKFLREEKNIHIEIDRIKYPTGYVYLVSVIEMEHNLCESAMTNNTYEEAIFEGIKGAVKILKEK